MVMEDIAALRSHIEETYGINLSDVPISKVEIEFDLNSKARKLVIHMPNSIDTYQMGDLIWAPA